MNERWFEEWTQQWLEGVPLTPAQGRVVATLLQQLAQAQAGEVVEDAELSENQARGHVEQRLQELFRCWFGRYAAGLRPAPVPLWEAPRPVTEAVLPWLQPVQSRPRLDLNSATLEELIALPLVGRVTAGAILRARRQWGGFRRLEELDQVPGVGPAMLTLFAERCQLGQGATARFSSPEQERFCQDPTLAGYVRLLVMTGGQWQRPGQPSTKHLAGHLLDELTALRDEVTAAPYPPFATLRATRASDVAAIQARRQAAADIVANSRPASGCLLSDRDYLPFVDQLLEAAQQRIELMLFYFKVEPQREYPVNRLLERLIERHRQGVAVRVLLDRDRPGEVYHSAEINREALQALQQAGVSVRQDDRGRLTHAKLLLVDGRHSVVGSHNWTAGSLCQYEETSVYLDSAALTADYAALFQSCWEAS